MAVALGVHIGQQNQGRHGGPLVDPNSPSSALFAGRVCPVLPQGVVCLQRRKPLPLGGDDPTLARFYQVVEQAGIHVVRFGGRDRRSDEQSRREHSAQLTWSQGTPLPFRHRWPVTFVCGTSRRGYPDSPYFEAKRA